MRHDAPFLVKRFAPMIGRPSSARRVSVYHNAFRLEWAMETAVYAAVRDAKRGIRSLYWIERREQPATRQRRAA